MRTLITFVCLLFVVAIHTKAAHEEFHLYGLRHLTQENGLSNNTLSEIHQDKKGFIWLGTDIGISRYDGRHFHNYNLIENVEPRAIERICEMEADNLLWLKIARHNEITCFDKQTGQFLRIEGSTPELPGEIYDICVADSTLYGLTRDGMVKFGYTRQKNGAIQLQAETLMKSDRELHGLCYGKGHLYAIDEEHNVVIYHLASHQKLGELTHKHLGTGKLSVAHIYPLNGHLWVDTQWDGLYCYDPATQAVRNLSEGNKHLENVTISDIGQLNDSTFIVATSSSLLRMTFAGTDPMTHNAETEAVRLDNFIYHSFIKNSISKIHIDRKNSVVWVGTLGKGFIMSRIENKEILRIALPDHIRKINSLAQDTEGYIWLATDHGGIYKSNTAGLTANIGFNPWSKSTPNSYYCLFKDNSGNLWIGAEDGTVQHYIPQTGELQTYKPTYDGVHSIGSIRKLYLCMHNRLWLVTDIGLFVYDCQADKCVALMTYNDKVRKVTALSEDGDGTMWLGTNDGIRNAVINDNGGIDLSNGYESKAGISNEEVLEAYVNRHNQLFVSYVDKIVQIDAPTQNVSSVKILHKDISSGHAECIIDDKSGNTWLGNTAGIMTIHNKSQATYTYNFPEMFNTVCQLNDGRLLWGNSTGLMCFNPRTLKDNSLCGKLYITDIDVNYNKVDIGENLNGQVILEKPIYLLDELELDNANNSVIFYLTDFGYNQYPNKIEYRLLPLSEEWTSSYKAEIELSNLEPGKYTLEVRPVSINEQDVPVTTLSLKVNKHWANTGWAYAGYIVIAALLAFSVVQYLKQKALKRIFYRKKEELLKKKLAEETEIRKEGERANQMRNTVRHNLAQELRTPLSLLIAPLKEMITSQNFPAGLLSKAKVAYRNSISMQDMCNQLLSIHEEENTDMNLSVAPYAASDLADKVICSSLELLNVTPIKLDYDKNNKVKREIWVDHRRMEFVLRNILSNAYRHISYAGHISFKVSIETVDGRECCVYTISDDGRNIIESNTTYHLSKYVTENMEGQKLPDLGSLIMNETVQAHHGDIIVEQSQEKGTTVIVCIPTGKAHFEGDERVSFVEPENTKVPEVVIPDEEIGENKEVRLTEEGELMAAAVPTAKHKMLVIEDHKDIRLYLKVLFSSTYNVIMAENGEEGLKMARKELPDIIISDVLMPVMNGFECCRILKEDLKTCHIPVIILTALVGDADIVKGIELGADDYILKPFNPEILRSKVKRLIKQRSELKQVYMKLLMSANMPEAQQEGKQEEVGQKEDPFIRQIFEIVEANLQNPDFNVKRLAEMLNMSQPTLYRRVKMLTNYTIIELIRGVRLKRSAELLRTRQYSIQEVAEMVGYNDAPTFRKHFVDFYGTTPSTFCNKESAEEKK